MGVCMLDPMEVNDVVHWLVGEGVLYIPPPEVPYVWQSTHIVSDASPLLML